MKECLTDRGTLKTKQNKTSLFKIIKKKYHDGNNVFLTQLKEAATTIQKLSAFLFDSVTNGGVVSPQRWIDLVPTQQSIA
jgi:hypothetical protein